MLLLLPVVLWTGILDPAASAAKTYAVVGIVDCGRASGQACTIGSTLRIRTTDISGELRTYEIDVSWIAGSLPSLTQDMEIRLEIEEDGAGGLRALSIVNPDPPKKKSSDDDRRDRDPDPTLTPTPTKQPGASNRPAITISIADAGEVDEGETATFVVSLSQPNPGPDPIRVDFVAVDGTAQKPVDFLPAAGTLTFAVGEQNKNVDVPVRIDDSPELEGEEDFFVDLSNPVGATIADGRGRAVIPFNCSCLDPLPVALSLTRE